MLVLFKKQSGDKPTANIILNGEKSYYLFFKHFNSPTKAPEPGCSSLECFNYKHNFFNSTEVQAISFF